MGSVFKHPPLLPLCKGKLSPFQNGIIVGSFFTYPRPLLFSSLPTQSFLPTVPPQPTSYHNASRRAEVQLNDKPILPGQEGDPGGWYKEEWPGDHRFIWLPPRRQDTEDFQLLLRLKLTIRMGRKGKSQEVTPFFPGPDFHIQNDTPLVLPSATQPSTLLSWKNN